MDLIRYLVVAEIGNRGFILKTFSSKGLAEYYHQKMFDLKEEYSLEKIESKLKYISSYNINGNEVYIENVELTTSDGVYTVSVVKINLENFCLKSFVRERENHSTVFDYDTSTPEELEKFNKICDYNPTGRLIAN